MVKRPTALQFRMLWESQCSRPWSYNSLLFLNCSKGLTQVCNQTRERNWMEKNLLLDLNQFRAQGLIVDFHFVPKDVVAHVIDLAYVTTCFPVHKCRLNPYFVQA